MGVSTSPAFRVEVVAPNTNAYGPLLSKLLPVTRSRSNGTTVRWYFGKHTSWVACPVDNKVYGFGGDGMGYYTSWGDSGGVGRVVSYDFSTDTFQDEYDTGGYAGRAMPERMDYVPVCWDSRRNVFWIVGGYRWYSGDPHVDQGVIMPGTTVPGRMWTFSPASPIQDRFTNVGAQQYPFEKKETFACAHDPTRDSIYVVRDGKLQWFNCSDPGTMHNVTLTGASFDGRGTDGRPQFIDIYTDELLWIDQLPGALMATKLGTGVTRIVKSGLPVATYIGTQDDHVYFIPRSGKPGTYVYAANIGNAGSWPLKYIDLETGVVRESVYESWRMAPNQGAYHPLARKILMLGGSAQAGAHYYAHYDAVARPPAIPAWAVSAGYDVNRWIQVPTTSIKSNWPNRDNVAKGFDDAVWTGGRSNLSYLDYSGATLRRKSSSILLAASGGGAARAGNDIIELCLEDSAPTWRTVLPSESRDAFPSSAAGTSPVRTKTGRPNTAHNYRSLHYSEIKDELWRITSKNHWPADSGWGRHWERWVWRTSGWATPGPDAPWDGTYKSDLPNQTHDEFHDTVLIVWAHDQPAQMAQGGEMWRAPSNDPSVFKIGVGVGHPAADTPYNSLYLPAVGSNPQLVPQEGGIVWHWWNNGEYRLTWFGVNKNGAGSNQLLWTPDIRTVVQTWYAGERYKVVKLMGPGLAEFADPNNMVDNNWSGKGVIWDPDNQCFLVYFPMNFKIFELRWSTYEHDYEADTLVVTRLLPTGSGPSLQRGDGIWSRLMYVPHLRGVALVNHERENCFFMRRK